MKEAHLEITFRKSQPIAAEDELANHFGLHPTVDNGRWASRRWRTKSSSKRCCGLCDQAVTGFASYMDSQVTKGFSDEQV